MINEHTIHCSILLFFLHSMLKKSFIIIINQFKLIHVMNSFVFMARKEEKKELLKAIFMDNKNDLVTDNLEWKFLEK